MASICSMTKRTRCLLTATALAHPLIRPRKPTRYHLSTTATSQTKKTGEASERPPFVRAPTQEKHPAAYGKLPIPPTSRRAAEAGAEVGVLPLRCSQNRCPCGRRKTCIIIILNSSSSSSSSHRCRPFLGLRPAIPRRERRCRRCSNSVLCKYFGGVVLVQGWGGAAFTTHQPSFGSAPKARASLCRRFRSLSFSSGGDIACGGSRAQVTITDTPWRTENLMAWRLYLSCGTFSSGPRP